MDSYVEMLVPEIGVLGALVIGAMAVAIIVLWRKLNKKDDRIQEKDARIQELSDLRAEDQKRHTDQLVEASNTVKLTLDWLSKLGINRV